MIGGRAARAFTTALLLALSAGAAAFAWQAYGDEAKLTIAQWVPQHVLAALLPSERPALAAPPTAPAVETATADTTPAQPAPPAASPAAAPTAAAASGEPVGPPRSTAPDLAAMGQEIEQLKASIEQLKAGQQQMSREIAKVSEAKASEAMVSEAKGSEAKASAQNLRPKMSALPPRPGATRARKPMPPVSPPQAAAYPASPPQAAAPYVPQPIQPPAQATTQTLADPELASVPRPPMPLR